MERVPYRKQYDLPKGKVYTLEELEELYQELVPFCSGFGKLYDPLKVCKVCNLCTVCAIYKSRMHKAKVELFREEEYHNQYFLDEYLTAVETPGHLFEMQAAFAQAIKSKGGESVPFENIQKALSNPESHWYYVDYMKTHDTRFPLLLFYSLSHFEGIEVDFEALTVRYNGE